MGGRRGAYRVLVERPERKSRFEDPGVDVEYNIEKDFQEV
jgi:hypothetical protein